MQEFLALPWGQQIEVANFVARMDEVGSSTGTLGAGAVLLCFSLPHRIQHRGMNMFVMLFRHLAKIQTSNCAHAQGLLVGGDTHCEGLTEAATEDSWCQSGRRCIAEDLGLFEVLV
jgi:hypothetical protein